MKYFNTIFTIFFYHFQDVSKLICYMPALDPRSESHFGDHGSRVQEYSDFLDFRKDHTTFKISIKRESTENPSSIDLTHRKKNRTNNLKGLVNSFSRELWFSCLLFHVYRHKHGTEEFLASTSSVFERTNHLKGLVFFIHDKLTLLL